MRKTLLFILILLLFKVADSMKFNMNTVYTIEEVTITVSKWDLLIKEIIRVESNNNHPDYLVGDNGRAIGPMQIHKIMVDEVNNLQDTTFYEYKDRWKLDKSIDMFNIYQSYYNPSKDLDLALRLWNGGPKSVNAKYAYLTEDYVNKFKLE